MPALQDGGGAKPVAPGRSIARRIVWLIVLTSAVLSALATAFALHQEYRRGIAELEAQFDWIGVSHVPALAANVWALDRDQTQQQLEGIRQLPAVVQAAIAGDLPWPAIARASGATDLGSILTRQYELAHADSQGGAPQRIGQLRVTVSLNSLHERLWAIAGHTLGLELLRASLLSTVLILGLRALVTRRLARIADYTAGLRLDNLDQAPSLHWTRGNSGDDIDRMAGAVDRMRLQLRDEIERRHEIEAHSRGLAVEKQAADLANATKSEFLASMSHEIRTPMNAVIGMAHLALQGPLPARERRYVEKVLGSAQLLLGILNDILDYSKVEAGMLQIELAEFDLQGLLDSVADVIGLRVEEKGLELVFDQAADLPALLVGDALRLRQVLLNLCSNAVKFTQRGHVTLRIEALERGERHIVLRFQVIDSGIGMSDDEMQQLFRPFTQADASIARRFGGTGLGLAISQRLMQLMGSRISVSSTPGQGSCFGFDLRLGLPASVPVPAPQPAATALRGRLLVVDDSEAARLVLGAMGQRLGFEVDAVADGEAALQAVQAAESAQRPYRIVLLDWRMPGMDGGECARRIAAASAHPPCVLMVSALNRDEMVRRLQQHSLPVAAVLTKPVTPSSLVDACHSALGLRGDARPAGAPLSDRLQQYRRRLAGLTVLLAEDNEVNVELACDVLERVGIEVVVARDGEQALAALHSQPVDGVLMDCQMPLVDGLEATRRLRAVPAWRTLPVIAMTANAMVGDREQALAAGMNDHVPKPIDVDVLYATLARWLPEPLPRRATAEAAVPAAHGLPVLPGIDIADGLRRTAGQEVLYRRLLRLFDRQQQRFDTELRAALDDGDRAAASALVHALKGAASTIGAHEVDLATQALERALAGEGDAAAVSSAVRALEQALARLRPGLALL